MQINRNVRQSYSGLVLLFMLFQSEMHWVQVGIHLTLNGRWNPAIFRNQCEPNIATLYGAASAFETFQYVGNFRTANKIRGMGKKGRISPANVIQAQVEQFWSLGRGMGGEFSRVRVHRCRNHREGGHEKWSLALGASLQVNLWDFT